MFEHEPTHAWKSNKTTGKINGIIFSLAFGCNFSHSFFSCTFQSLLPSSSPSISLSHFTPSRTFVCPSFECSIVQYSVYTPCEYVCVLREAMTNKIWQIKKSLKKKTQISGNSRFNRKKMVWEQSDCAFCPIHATIRYDMSSSVDGSAGSRLSGACKNEPENLFRCFVESLRAR